MLKSALTNFNYGFLTMVPRSIIHKQMGSKKNLILESHQELSKLLPVEDAVAVVYYLNSARGTDAYDYPCYSHFGFR